MNVAMTAYNRPECLREVVASWEAADSAYVNLWAFVEPSPVADEVEEILRRARFANVEVFRNGHVRGPLNNPWHALETVFGETQDDFILLAEDDSVVAPDVLRAFEWADQSFGAGTALAVCAFQQHPGENLARWRLQEKFHATIWATWADRWYDLLRDTWDHDYSHNGWDWNINRIRGDRLFVAPEVSRSQHIGVAGAHCTPEIFESTKTPTFASDYKGSYVIDRRNG